MVADRGLMSADNLAATEEAGCEWIVATRLHRDTNVAAVRGRGDLLAASEKNQMSVDTAHAGELQGASTKPRAVHSSRWRCRQAS